MIYLFFALLVGFLIMFFYYKHKFFNPYKLVLYFGKKGCGKSTTAVKLCWEHIQKGWIVYANFDIPYARRFDVNNIGSYQFPKNSLVLIDEAGICFDNRNYKEFKHTWVVFFKLMRHAKVKCIMFSQTFDVDKKLRDLCDLMYLTTNLFGFISYSKRIIKTIKVIEASSMSESRIADSLAIESFFWFWLGSRKFVFLPKWVKHFNSFEIDELPPMPFEVNTCSASRYVKKYHLDSNVFEFGVVSDDVKSDESS